MKVQVIFNPHAGKKRQMLPLQTQVTLEEIKSLLSKYQIPAKFTPTKYPGHATILAQKAAQRQVDLVIAAGGDGTIGEVASGLLGSEVTLAILPLGSFMNVARMLDIPNDLEKAIQLIKIGRTRKIDVGVITELNGSPVNEPAYFLEEAGIGLEADVHNLLTGIFERQIYSNIFQLPRVLWEYYGQKAKIYLDNQTIETRAILISVANGPFTGASLHWAPDSRLNDHKFTVSIYEMTKWQITKYLLRVYFLGKSYSPQITTYQSKTVKIETSRKKMVHADARIFGSTPVKFEILPGALKVITGFPQSNTSLNKRTPLDP